MGTFHRADNVHPIAQASKKFRSALGINSNQMRDDFLAEAVRDVAFCAFQLVFQRREEVQSAATASVEFFVEA
jgi:hypothetical protein